MNRYEGMFILPQSIAEENLDDAIGRVRGEIEKLGGEVDTATRLGKRDFARPLAKRDTGHYVVINFRMDGGNVAPLIERFRLVDEVFRVQIVAAAAPQPVAEPEADEEKRDGVAE